MWAKAPLLFVTKEQQQFIQVIEPLRARLYRFISLNVQGSTDDIHDVLQDTILAAWLDFAKLRDKTTTMSWLFTIAIRCCFRFTERSNRTEQLTVEQINEQVSTHIQPDVQTDIILLYEALQKLPALVRESIILADIVDMKLEDIALAQGSTLSAVKSRVTRGREQLQKMLSETTPISHSLL